MNFILESLKMSADFFITMFYVIGLLALLFLVFIFAPLNILLIYQDDFKCLFNEHIQNNVADRLDDLVKDTSQKILKHDEEVLSGEVILMKRRMGREGPGSVALHYAESKETADRNIENNYSTDYRKDCIYRWNEQLYLFSSVENASHTVNRKKEFFSILTGTALLLLLLSMTLMARAQKRKGQKTNLFFFFFPLAGTLIVLFILTIWTIPAGARIPSRTKDVQTIETYSEKFLKMYQNTKHLQITQGGTTKLAEIGFQSAFVAKAPLFPVEYVRFDLTPFEYIFAGIENPKEINPHMEYTKLSDKIWFGKYKSMLQEQIIINRMLAIWITAILIAFGVFSFIFFHKRNISIPNTSEGSSENNRP